MKKYISLAALVLLSFYMMGMSSAVDNELKSSADDHKSEKHSSNYSKPHAGIDLQYQRPKNIQVGESINLKLSLSVRAQAEQLMVKVTHDDGLQLNTEPEFEFDTLLNKKNKMTLAITALQEGRWFINLSATILVAGKHQSRSFIIPVTVGDPANFKSNTETMENSHYRVDKEHGVVSMPALETSK